MPFVLAGVAVETSCAVEEPGMVNGIVKEGIARDRQSEQSFGRVE